MKNDYLMEIREAGDKVGGVYVGFGYEVVIDY